MLSDDEIAELGLAASVKLINAPTRESTRTYWRQCSKALIALQPMPLPPPPPEAINTTFELDASEFSIACADIYMWLGHREEFQELAPDLNDVREMRQEWSESIDEALLKRIKQVKVCSQCGKELPAKYPYGMCETCFQGRVKDFR